MTLPTMINSSSKGNSQASSPTAVAYSYGISSTGNVKEKEQHLNAEDTLATSSSAFPAEAPYAGSPLLSAHGTHRPQFGPPTSSPLACSKTPSLPSNNRPYYSTASTVLNPFHPCILASSSSVSNGAAACFAPPPTTCCSPLDAKPKKPVPRHAGRAETLPSTRHHPAPLMIPRA